MVIISNMLPVTISNLHQQVDYGKNVFSSTLLNSLG